MRSVDSGVLSSMSVELPGYPFGSVTPYVLTHDGRAVIYVSAIAQHTANMLGDARCCLTVMDNGKGNQQALGRATLVGDGCQVPGDRVEEAGERYFAVFPEARGYGEAHAFEFFWIEPKRIRYIGGFGKIYWVETEEWCQPGPEWASGEAGMVTHMNDDHGDALLAIARQHGSTDIVESRLLAMDPEGFHIKTNVGVLYIAFPQPCLDAKAVREALVAMAHGAREGASKASGALGEK